MAENGFIAVYLHKNLQLSKGLQKFDIKKETFFSNFPGMK